MFNYNESYNYLLKCVIIGDSGVGKSSILSQLCYRKYNTSMLQTIGVDFFTRTFKINNSNIKYHIWDTSGNPRFKNIIDAYYNKADVIIICYDISNRSTFNNIDNWYKNIQDVHNKLIFIIGNKSDKLLVKSNLKGLVMCKELKKKALKFNVYYGEVSAMNNTNIDEVFKDIGKVYLKNHLNSVDDNDIIILSKCEKLSMRRCC